ncbi:MAG: endonuclease domain-containing protein [Clostridia bacterium]|nr:endonuclease domain-containing protein [Clostridia bacterium]
MNDRKNGRLTPYSKVLRKNMTDEEKRLWYDCLKYLPMTVNRQKVIGKYIVDFYCASARLVIEVDGVQHASDEGLANDRQRDEYLESLGLFVLRIANHDINTDFDNVCTGVYDIVKERCGIEEW